MLGNVGLRPTATGGGAAVGVAWECNGPEDEGKDYGKDKGDSAMPC